MSAEMVNLMLIVFACIHVLGMLVFGWTLVWAINDIHELRREWLRVAIVVLLWEIFLAERIYRLFADDGTDDRR